MILSPLRIFAASAAIAALAACATTPPAPDKNIANEPPAELPVMSSAPLDRREPISRIAFGSCLGEDGDQSIWSEIADVNPELFLFIGDNVYGDMYTDDPDFANPAMPKMRASYATLAKSKPFAELRQSTPVLTVWDDHDYGLNDGGAAFIHKHEAEEIFETVWGVGPTDERARHDGVYGSWNIGTQAGKRLQVILLDTRFFRSEFKKTDEPDARGKERYVPDPTSAKTMLGAEQWRWLNQELLKPADLRLVVSSIQVVADGHGWEAWKMLPSERERLYNMINTTGAENVILLSGDRHAGAVYRKDLVLSYPLYEVTSSSLNKPGSIWREESGETYVEPGPNRLGGMVYEANFGLIDIDWEAETVSLQLRGEDGGMIREETVSLSDLRPVY